jgi:hypothetical protein
LASLHVFNKGAVPGASGLAYPSNFLVTIFEYLKVGSHEWPVIQMTQGVGVSGCGLFAAEYALGTTVAARLANVVIFTLEHGEQSETWRESTFIFL